MPIAHSLDELRTSDVRLNLKLPFAKMMIRPELRKGLENAGFIYPTILQAMCIPMGQLLRDMFLQAKSGTGKTLIFSVITLQRYSPGIRAPQALIIAPTREIAVQITMVLNELGKYIKSYRAVTIIGGTDVAEDRQNLQGAATVVGTPGRVLHLIKSDVLNTAQIELLVLDEADLLQNSNYKSDIKAIRAKLSAKFVTLACSATFSNDMDKIMAKEMNDPLHISLDEKNALLLGIKQFICELPVLTNSLSMGTEQKIKFLRDFFAGYMFKQCVVFANSKMKADTYRNMLKSQGVACDLMLADMEQSERLKIFKRFQQFESRMLITTDLMARGVDFANVNLVINLDMPMDATTYLHRIGRAGRFAAHGWAVTFVASVAEKKTLHDIVEQLGIETQIFKIAIKNEQNITQSVIGENADTFAGDFEYYMEDIAAQALPGCSDMLDVPVANTETTEAISVSVHTETDNGNVPKPPHASIDTNTFGVNNQFHGLDHHFKELVLNESPRSSTQALVSSNTIDDASSIAADSHIESSQNDNKFVETMPASDLMKLLLANNNQLSNTDVSKLNPYDDFKKSVLEANEKSNGIDVDATATDDEGDREPLKSNNVKLLSEKIPDALHLAVPESTNSSDEPHHSKASVDTLTNDAVNNISIGELENSSVSTDRIAVASTAHPQHHTSPIQDEWDDYAYMTPFDTDAVNEDVQTYGSGYIPQAQFISLQQGLHGVTEFVETTTFELVGPPVVMDWFPEDTDSNDNFMMEFEESSTYSFEGDIDDFMGMVWSHEEQGNMPAWENAWNDFADEMLNDIDDIFDDELSENDLPNVNPEVIWDQLYLQQVNQVQNYVEYSMSQYYQETQSNNESDSSGDEDYDDLETGDTNDNTF